MILSYSMFNKMNISVNTFTNRNGSHSIVPNLKIASLKDIYNVGVKRVDVSRYNINRIVSRCGTQNILERALRNFGLVRSVGRQEFRPRENRAYGCRRCSGRRNRLLRKHVRGVILSRMAAKKSRTSFSEQASGRS